MFQMPILTVAALLGAAVLAPAQIRIEGNLGRAIRVAADIASDRCLPPRREPRCEPRHEPRYEPRYDRRCEPRHQPRGHWETVTEQVHIPGYWREECVPAQYGWVRDHCGRMRWEEIAPAYTRQVWVPERCETRTRQVWVNC